MSKERKKERKDEKEKMRALEMRHKMLDDVLYESKQGKYSIKLPSIIDIFWVIPALAIFLVIFAAEFIFNAAMAVGYLFFQLFVLLTDHYIASIMTTMFVCIAAYITINSDTRVGEVSREIIYEITTEERTLADSLMDFGVSINDMPEELKPLLYALTDENDMRAIQQILIERSVGENGEGAIEVLGSLLVGKKNKVVGAALHSLMLINTPEAQYVIREAEKKGYIDQREYRYYLDNSEQIYWDLQKRCQELLQRGEDVSSADCTLDYPQ